MKKVVVFISLFAIQLILSCTCSDEDIVHELELRDISLHSGLPSTFGKIDLYFLYVELVYKENIAINWHLPETGFSFNSANADHPCYPSEYNEYLDPVKSMKLFAINAQSRNRIEITNKFRADVPYNDNMEEGVKLDEYFKKDNLDDQTHRFTLVDSTDLYDRTDRIQFAVEVYLESGKIIDKVGFAFTWGD